METPEQLTTEEVILLASADGDFTAINPETRQAVIYQGVTAKLDCQIVNNTGKAIKLQPNSSELEIFFPTFFSETDVSNMKVDFPNWTPTPKPKDSAILLKYSGAKSDWPVGMPLKFAITNVLSKATPDSESLQVNPDNLGDLPSMLTTTLSLSLPPNPGKAPLPIQVNLDGNGEIFISKGGQALSNSISLNIKNTGDGPLYSGTTPRKGKPRVIVSFVYGTTAGSLAPDTDRSQGAVASAWNIEAAPAVTEGNAWRVINPRDVMGLKHPVWVLEPTLTNTEVIGGRGKSNVTFSFAKIVSFTPEGHTDMVVQFTGFSETQDKDYEDKVFVLDISKKQPPNPGVNRFFCPLPLIEVSVPDAVVQVPLNWTMFSVASVELLWTGGSLLKKTYTNRPPLDQDSTTVSLPYKQILEVMGRNRVATVKFTLNAYGTDGKLLNPLSWDVQVQGLWKLQTFTSSVSSVTVDDPARPLEIPFHWDMFDVERIKLECGMQGVPPYVKKYDPPQLKASDETKMKIGPALLGHALSPYPNDLLFTLTAAEGDLTLNSLSHRISVVSRFFEDPRDHQKYPVAEIENPRTHRKTLWMARNLNFDAGAEASRYYKDDPKYAAQYGRIYIVYVGYADPPRPWRVATQRDWLELLEIYDKDPARTYTALLAGGSSGLNLQLGGVCRGTWGFAEMGVSGVYFGSYPAQTAHMSKGKFSYTTQIVAGYASVRYVRDL